MLSYKTCLKLKEAGFPQKGKGTCTHNGIRKGKLELIYSPTLEELIEWCGDKFLRLDSPSSIQEAFDTYEVEKTADHWNAVGRIDKRKELYITGKTPSEAVAELGLKLHN